jgi:hypothetical protein
MDPAKIARRLGVAALGAALLAIPAGYVLDRAAGVDVVLILPHPPEAVELNRSVRDAGDPVAEIYGTPVGGDAEAAAAPGRARTTRVLFPRAERTIRPVEEPGTTLLVLDKQAGDNPLQAVTVRYLARTVALGAAAVGAALLVLAALLGRRSSAARS